MASYKLDQAFTFRQGDEFETEDGQRYKVTGFLGRGGQGEVYRVTGADGEYALKWYHTDRYLGRMGSRYAEAFYKNLKRNAENGPPQLSSGDTATQFIWPLKMVRPQRGSFGYLMALFPEGYEQLRHVFLLRKKDGETGKIIPLAWKSWFVRITAALNIVRAFEILHKSGLSYQDLNAGGISVDMENGSVMICDCDNVSPDKSNLGIRGQMYYMAPEIVRGEKLPDRLTDQYSLALILFRLLMQGHHPLNGLESKRLHNSESISKEEVDLRIFGTQPHYCLAGGDNPNPLDIEANRDVYQLYYLYPRALMDAFERVFTEGIFEPQKRLTATEWRRVLLDVRDHLVQVNGEEKFFDPRREKPLPPACRTMCYPLGRRVLCMPGKILYKYHLDEYGADYKEPVAKVIPTNQPGIIGLYNRTGQPIRYGLGGQEAVCPDQGRMPLLRGMVVSFGQATISIE